MAKRDVSGVQLVVVPVEPDDVPAVAAILERVTGAVAAVDVAARSATAPTELGVAALGAVAVSSSAPGTVSTT